MKCVGVDFWARYTTLYHCIVSAILLYLPQFKPGLRYYTMELKVFLQIIRLNLLRYDILV